MNIFVHEGFMKERRRQIRRRQLIGVACIAVSLVLSFASFTPTTAYLIFLAYPFLLVGFPLWTSARSAERKLASSPRPDATLNAELKGLNNKYTLHHYPRVGETWIQHLLITPSGLIAMATSDAVGPVRCRGGEKGDRWKSPTNLLDRMTGLKPPIGNPSQDLDAATNAAHQLLNTINKPDVPVKGIVLFTRNPDVEIEGCNYNGAPMHEAKQAVRDLQLDMGGEREEGLDVSTILTSEDRRKLNNFLAPESIPAPAAAAPTKKQSAKRNA